MGLSEHRANIELVANAHGVSPDLVEAMVFVESNDNQWAWNPEPRYRWLWNVRLRKPYRSITPAELASKVPPVDFPCLAGDRDQEWWGQQASWGLMQVMGAVAREQGYREPYLTRLCFPLDNLEIGCRHLRMLLTWSGNQTSKALEAYNGGKGSVGSAATTAYARKVFLVLKAIQDGRV